MASWEGAGAPLELVTYPDAHHAFDVQIFQPGMFGHWTEYNAEAAEDARRKIRALLADVRPAQRGIHILRCFAEIAPDA